MPAVQPGSLVLVTGASGFIATHVTNELLSRGFKVRGTVRSVDKGEWLVKKFGKEFSYTLVADLQEEEGFSEAVKGVDAIAHTASPYHHSMTDPYKDFIGPAKTGTLSLLGSALKYGDKVKRIVLTSSFAAINNTSIPPVYTFTEEDWNTHSPAQLEKHGKDTHPMDVYRASKTLAERAAWDFVAMRQPEWDLVTMNPPFVLGPIIHQVNAPEALNTSVADWYAFLVGTSTPDQALLPSGSEVDVRDLAVAHAQALQVEEAAGQRFAVTCQAYTWQQAIDVVYGNTRIRNAFPQLKAGKFGAGDKVQQNLLDGRKSREILGLTLRSFQDTITDMSLSLAEREIAGWTSS